MASRARQMKSLAQRITFGISLGLTHKEAATLTRLNTPSKIQDFINAMPPNFEPDGDTCYSARTALRKNRCHCIEAAFIAAAALWINGDAPLLLDLRGKNDFDHVVVVFKRNGAWGAISKSNHLWHRWRDPVYRSLRELVMSYFHEYLNSPPTKKTLWAFSTKPFDLRKAKKEMWLTGEDDCWDVALQLDYASHTRLLTDAQAKSLRKLDTIQIHADSLHDFRQPKPKKAKR